MSKTRACPDCGNKMSLKKSSKSDNKFWGCTGYPECKATLPYHGDGARAGCSLDIRQIENGFVIVASNKYLEDDEPREFFCNEDQLTEYVTSICTAQTHGMVDRLKEQLSGGFDKAEGSENSARGEKIQTPKLPPGLSNDAAGNKSIKNALDKAKNQNQDK